MKRARLLRVMLQAFSAWLAEHMEPAGKAALHGFEARASVLIDALPQDGHAPELAVLETLDASSVATGLDWLLTALRVAYPDDWAPVAVEALRVLLHRNLADVVAMTHPPVTTPQPTPQEAKKS